MSFVIEPPQTPSLPVVGTEDRFPIRRIFCVGRNYAAHAREMGNDPDREPPFFFMKPADAVAHDGDVIPFPPETNDLHHEGELVVALGKGGVDLDPSDALAHVWGYAAGIDLTRRDVQAVAKSMSRPWDLSKGFDNSAVIGPIHPANDVGGMNAGTLRLTVNGEERQNGDLADMIWPTPDVIAFLSRSVELAPGDLIMTGTPAGVSQLVPGDRVVVEIAGLSDLTVEIGA